MAIWSGSPGKQKCLRIPRGHGYKVALQSFTQRTCLQRINSMLNFLVLDETGTIGAHRNFTVVMSYMHLSFKGDLVLRRKGMCFVRELALLEVLQPPFKFREKCDFLSFWKTKTLGRNVSFRLWKIQVAVANIMISSFSEFGFKRLDLKFVSHLFPSLLQADNTYYKGSPNYLKFY